MCVDDRFCACLHVRVLSLALVSFLKTTARKRRSNPTLPQADLLMRHSVLHKYYQFWVEEAEDTRTTKTMTEQLYQVSAAKNRTSAMLVNMFLSDKVQGKRQSVASRWAVRRSMIGYTGPGSVLDKEPPPVDVFDAMKRAMELGIARACYSGWVTWIRARARNQMQATMALRRVARAVGKGELWTGELLKLVFALWARCVRQSGARVCILI